MNKIVAAVCAGVLVIALHSEQCFSLDYNSIDSDNVKNYHSDEKYTEFEIPDSYEIKRDQKTPNHPVFENLFRNNKEKDVFVKAGEEHNRRVVRQAYQSQASLYPHLPSGPPYGLEPYPNNNQNPSNNPQWQNSYKNNNLSQPGYSSQANGYQQNHNNPYGTNTQFPYNNTQPSYPNFNSYKPSNFTHTNPSGPYGQNLQPNSWQPASFPPNNGHSPSGYNPPHSNYPSYNNSSPNSYPGFKPANAYNNSSSKPPYFQHGQFQNNSYPGYPSQTPGYRPGSVNTPGPYPYTPNVNPQHYSGQSQLNNTRYPQVGPGNTHPVVYDDSTKRPGQNPYGSYNATNWPGNILNNTQGRPPYSQNGQNPQYFNGSPGYGSQNSNNTYNNQRPPSFGQYPSNSYPGNSSGSATFNLASGYNPSIPNQPPYGSGTPYGNPQYGSRTPQNQFQYPNGYDPTKVSPQHFNSY